LLCVFRAAHDKQKSLSCAPTKTHSKERISNHYFRAGHFHRPNSHLVYIPPLLPLAPLSLILLSRLSSNQRRQTRRAPSPPAPSPPSTPLRRRTVARPSSPLPPSLVFVLPPSPSLPHRRDDQASPMGSTPPPWRRPARGCRIRSSPPRRPARGCRIWPSPPLLLLPMARSGLHLRRRRIRRRSSTHREIRRRLWIRRRSLTHGEIWWRSWIRRRVG
jgi:hypothetical protein